MQVTYFLSLHHVEQVAKGRLFWVVKGQQSESALHLCQALTALLSLLCQMRLCKLQCSLSLPQTDQLDQMLLLHGGKHKRVKCS